MCGLGKNLSFEYSCQRLVKDLEMKVLGLLISQKQHLAHSVSDDFAVIYAMVGVSLSEQF